jgi:hypothetical protein
MGLSTKKVPTNETLDKKTKIALLLEHHRPTLNKLGVTAPHFCPKMAYIDKGERVISFFPSEVEKGEDIYVEFVSRDYDSEDETRTLYKWKFNPHYATEYRITEPHTATHTIRYIIPVAELFVVSAAQASMEMFDMPDPDSDLPISQLTIRDLAAILLGKPVSMKPWLNEIVRNK